MRDEVEHLQAIGLKTIDLAGDYAAIQALEGLGGELRLEIRVERGVVGDHRGVRNIALVAGPGMRHAP